MVKPLGAGATAGPCLSPCEPSERYGEGPSHAPGSALGYDRPFRNAGTSTSFGLPGVFFGHNLMRGGQGDDRLSVFNGGGILYGNEGADTIDATSATAAA